MPMKASSGIELLVRLERGSTVPLHLQLERQLREAARTGRLRPGAPLPSTRALAGELGVARGVVLDAYTQLTAEGYLISRQGAATQVAERAACAQPPARPAGQPHAPRFDLRPGTPDVSLFPRQAWATALRQALKDAPDDRLRYPDPHGAIELRRALTAYLGRVRGILADPDAFVITSGLAQGLALACRALRSRGARRIAIEDPGPGPIRAQIAAIGLEPAPIPVDRDGIVVSAMRGDVAAALATPAHQFPTGVVLSPARRAALLEWAAAHDTFVLEDDYDAEYRYDRPPVGAVQGLDPERVVYLGSVSKTLAPALRTGWLVAPPALADRIVFEKANDDKGTPVLEQLALAILLERGELDRHVRRSRQIYRRRRDVLVDALARHLPDARPDAVAAGLHILLQLPGDLDDRAVVEAARRRDIAVAGLSEHCVMPHAPALILGYGQIADGAIELAVRELARAVGEIRLSRSPTPRRRRNGNRAGAT
jgi:GntR family transcriptional regulator/MocR family aminotransferase